MKFSEVVPVFDFDEKRDLEISPAWFLDATHSIPPWTPMHGWFSCHCISHGMQWGAEMMSLPGSHGWTWRYGNGGAYVTILPVKSEEEKKEREKRFREALVPFITDFDGLWQGYIDEMLGHYEGLKKLDLDKATNIELLDNFEQAFIVCRRMWDVHMYMMYGTYTAYMLFENMCREIVGIDDTSPLFHKLTAGFDNKVFQVDKRLWEFSREAQEMGISSIFLENEPNDIQPKLQANPKGQEFMVAFNEFLNEDGWRMQDMSELNLPTWIEDPRPALVSVKQFLSIEGDFNLEDERAKRSKERTEAEAEVLSKVSAEQMGWFTTLMRLAQKSGIFSEEHDHYLDLYSQALNRRACMGLGRRFVKEGALDAPEDIFFLVGDEVRQAAFNPSFFNLRSVAQRRRTEYESWCKEMNPPVILKEGLDMDQAMGALVGTGDPIALKVVVGSMPVVRPELKADLHGTCGSPGVVEGVARVVYSEEQLAEVQPGEILVAATTSPSWTPVFSFISGVVVDRGASLSHAAIVGREYGIPVLMNVFTGTQVIKTGQRIRLDANMGALYILDK